MLLKPINWITGVIEILGTHFGNEETLRSSFVKRIDKLEKRINTWCNRSLSLKGKVMIINTLGLSSLIYVCTIFPIPQDLITRINKIIFSLRISIFKIWIVLTGCFTKFLGVHVQREGKSFTHLIISKDSLKYFVTSRLSLEWRTNFHKVSSAASLLQVLWFDVETHE